MKSLKEKYTLSNGVEISKEDMTLLKNIEKIKDYGNVSMMPVYGGKMNLKTMLKIIFGSK